MISQRNIGLDYLRSLAILIVLANHCLIGFFFSTSRIKFDGIIVSISSMAVVSIEWLFVLSGYLIGTMMIRSFERETTWFRRARDFWLRRWFRTLPNYYLFAIINLVLVFTGIAQGAFEYKYFWFSQNLYTAETAPHFFGEAWSLALDEWFYVAMPILIGFVGLLLPGGGRVVFFSVSILLIAVPMVARSLHAVPTSFFQWDDDIRRITLYHLDATGWGVLAAVINKWNPIWWQGNIYKKMVIGGISMGVGLFFVVGLSHPEWMNPLLYRINNVLSITLISGGTLLILPWLTQLRGGWDSVQWVVGKLSLYSYSIYLVHFPMVFIILAIYPIHAETSAWILTLIVIIWFFSVMVVSAFIFNAFEKPISDLREKFTQHVDASPFSLPAVIRRNSVAE